MGAFLNAFTMAAQILGDGQLTRLTPGQLAQLRAVDHRYQQRVYTLRHAVERAAEPPGAQGDPTPARAEREMTAAEVEDLRATIVSGILEMLTPEQRGALDRS